MRLLRQKLADYAALMRLDRPIGIWLLLWPTLWALWIAADGPPDRSILLIFVLGVVLMRSAGCVINDVSEREFQLERSGSWDKGKGCDTFGPLGPWLVTRDEIADPQSLDMWLEVDGKRYQDGNSRTMVYQIPYLVAYLSRFMSLQPGDVISTGTPPGVGAGQKPQVFLKPGQTMRLGIEGLGEQCQRTKQA